MVQSPTGQPAENALLSGEKNGHQPPCHQHHRDSSHFLTRLCSGAELPDQLYAPLATQSAEQPHTDCCTHSGAASSQPNRPPQNTESPSRFEQTTTSMCNHLYNHLHTPHHVNGTSNLGHFTSTTSWSRALLQQTLHFYPPQVALHQSVGGGRRRSAKRAPTTLASLRQSSRSSDAAHRRAQPPPHPFHQYPTFT